MTQEGAIDPFFKISTFLNTTKICKYQGCFPNIFYKDIKGAAYIDFYNDNIGLKGVLTNGMIYRLYSSAGDTHCSDPRGTSMALLETCGALLVDINGAKGPNTLGKDTFEFWITRSAIIPQGTPQDTGASLKTRCHDDGYGCTAWVLMKENLNYPPDWE